MNDLRELPPEAVYHAREGQATVTVGRGDEPGTIEVEASCDSLERRVQWYEEELTRIRGDTTDRRQDTVQTAVERRPNPLLKIITAFIAGLAAGTILTLFIKKKYGK